MSGLLLGLALLAGDARAQASDILATQYQPEDCLPRPIPGTVGYELGRQSIETNAQAYGAEAIVDQALSQGSPFALRLNNVYGVIPIPAVTQCGTGQMFGTVALDLFSSASGVQFSIPLGSYQPRLFYAGSVTGSVIHYPDGTMANSRYYTSWAYAGFGYLSSFLAPLAPLLSRDDGLQTMVGDFIAGAAFDVPGAPKMGTLTLGYVYSSGFYSNVSSKKLKLFGSTLFTQDFSLLSVARLGARELELGGEEIGQTTLYARTMVLQAPGGLRQQQDAGFEGLFAEKANGVDLSTIHLSQQRIGGYVTVSAALAVRPTVFLHEGSVGVELPVQALGVDTDLEMAWIKGVVGVSELPALPWYGNEGGRQLYFDVSVMEMFHVRRNAPETLSIFPYAQGATELQVFIDVAKLMEDADDKPERRGKKGGKKGKKGKKKGGAR